MTSRWVILAVLSLARMAMALQFQSVAAVTPLVAQTFGVGLGEVGFLIGLYLAPGIALALPGGVVGRALGDRRAVLLGMALMLAGGVIPILPVAWDLVLAGRLLAGSGGVLLNVLMAKMVTDWFAGRELATAMGFYVNSWPVGIALALVVLPHAAGVGGLQLAWGAVVIIVGVAMLLFAAAYQPPSRGFEPRSAPPAARLPIVAVVLAGAVWALSNAAFAIVSSFGASLLAQRGWSLEAASGTTSIVLSVPLGGVLAGRFRRRYAVLSGGLVGFAALLAVAVLVPTPGVVWVFVALGLVAGLPAGPRMSLPAAVLQPSTRALGMGLFFMIYYVAMMTAPAVGGMLAETRDDVAAAFWLGVALLAMAMGAHAGFLRASARSTEPA